MFLVEELCTVFASFSKACYLSFSFEERKKKETSSSATFKLFHLYAFLISEKTKLFVLLRKTLAVGSR